MRQAYLFNVCTLNFNYLLKCLILNAFYLPYHKIEFILHLPLSQLCNYRPTLNNFIIFFIF